MGRRALVGTVATLGVVALVGLFASLSLLFSSPSSIYAQGTNSAPTFDDGETTTREVAENTAAFTDIGAPVAATDADDDWRVYTLEDAHTSPFTIVRATGQLQVGQPLDHETKSSYEVKVQVTDSEDADGNFENPAVIDDTITVTITVNNVEENGKVSLTWTRPQVGAAITAELTDPDIVDGTVTWKWEKSSNKSSWNDISNATLTTYTPQSGDGYLRVTASYTDGKGSANKTAQAITATPVQAAPDPNSNPDITVNTSGGYGCGRSGFTGGGGDICLWIPRKSPAGDDLYYPAHVTDSDHHEWRYTLEGSDAGSFDIHPTRGTLYTTEAHIYDRGTFEITIKVTDPSDGSDSIDVVLKPSGGEGPPVVNGPSRITYPENGTWSLAKYTASAANQGEDGGSRPIEGWIIAVQPGGGDGDFFDIDDDGNLTFTQPPDYENPADDNEDNRYSFSLHVYDTNPPNGGRPAQTFFSVTVIVEDVTVEALEIDGPSAVRYPENGKEPVATYTLSTEQGATAAVDEWVLSGADGDEFSISATGVLTFKRSPDYENPTDAAEENAYLVTITAYSGSDSKTEFIRVSVTDVNEPPEFDEGNTATRSVDSTAEVNDPFGDPILATDPDDDFLTYRLPDDFLPFSISPSTGQLWVDGEVDQTKTSYLVTVEVTDGADADGIHDPHDPDGPGGSNTDDTIIVTVKVDGAGNNNAPTFPSTETGARSIAEKTTGVVNVGAAVGANDDDTDDTLTYTLEGTDSVSFGIVSTSGQIQTKATETYDYENKSSYSVTVKADDNRGGTATKNVTITLTNVEEAGTVRLSPTQPAARQAVTATLTDPDEVSGTPTWQWQRSSDGNTDWTNVGTHSSSYTPPDADLNYYLQATATYTDGQGSDKTAAAKTVGAVQAGTNRAPTFDDGQTTSRDVAEDAAATANVGAVVGATDQDNDSLTYSLTSTDASSFTVDNTGQIKVGATTTLDYESAKNTYTVVVQVTDSKDPAGDTETNPTIDDTITVTINVTNVNEDGTVSLSMTHPSARTPITATLSDPDSGVTGESWQWAKASTAQGTYINIATATSAIYTPADEDVSEFLRATVSYEDDHDQNQTAEAVSANAVQAGANRAPTFAAGAVTLTVPENSTADVNVGSPITANDPDTSNTLIYSLEGTDKDSFKIVSDSGQIQTKQGVTYNYEDKASYSVTVKADDGNGDNATKAVTINLTDAEDAGTVTLSTSQPVARTQLTATLTDPDGGVTGETWQWAKSSTAQGQFTNINNSCYARDEENGRLELWINTCWNCTRITC